MRVVLYMRRLGMRSLWFAIALAGCATPATTPATIPAAPTAEAAAADTIIALAGGGNALWWDDAGKTLYLTDNNTGALVQWTEAGGLQQVAAFPQSPAGVSLGGIVRRPDGTTFVTSFGFGKEGTVFQLAGEQATALAGLDPVRRRIALAQDERGALYTGYFVGKHGETPIGGVARLTIDGATAGETEIAGASTQAGLQKIVGLVATEAALYVADQGQQAIFRIDLSARLPDRKVAQLARVPKVDMLLRLPGGDLLTGSGSAIVRVAPTGAVTPVPGAPCDQVRGLAYDAAGKRLFIIDHSATPGRPDRLRIRSFAE